MATLAVFIALGGTGYAVSQINGSQIKDRSIPGGKLKLGAVTAQQINPQNLTVPFALVSQQTQNLVLAGHPTAAHHARAASVSTGTQSIVVMSIDQSKTVLQSGPFIYFANCTADSNGRPEVSIEAESSEAGSVIDFGSDAQGHPLSYGPIQLTPGQPVYEQVPTTTQLGFLINGAHMLSSTGEALTVNLSYGTQLLGAQCWATGYGIG